MRVYRPQLFPRVFSGVGQVSEHAGVLTAIDELGYDRPPSEHAQHSDDRRYRCPNSRSSPPSHTTSRRISRGRHRPHSHAERPSSTTSPRIDPPRQRSSVSGRHADSCRSPLPRRCRTRHPLRHDQRRARRSRRLFHRGLPRYSRRGHSPASWVHANRTSHRPYRPSPAKPGHSRRSWAS